MPVIRPTVHADILHSLRHAGGPFRRAGILESMQIVRMTNIGIDGQTILMGEINDVPQIVPVGFMRMQNRRPLKRGQAISRISVLLSGTVSVSVNRRRYQR